ncbi:MAG TPA: hypothetical protein VMP03_16680 [Methylomirabilota bacterium]|nr:hypothetical protein [Methylomirabilota bacterium]
MADILLNIREGMTVRDSAGEIVGSVEFIHFSDEDSARPGPETATTGMDPASARLSLIDIIADAFRDHHVPDELREHLLRSGFIRIDAKGMFAADRYVLPDQIQSVSGDEVQLGVTRDQLVMRA